MSLHKIRHNLFFTRFLTYDTFTSLSLTVNRTAVGLLACSVNMFGSRYKPNLKVRTLDEMFKKISESSENDPEQLAHTSENSPALRLFETDSGPVESESS